jgi:hypothetical protein
MMVLVVSLRSRALLGSRVMATTAVPKSQSPPSNPLIPEKYLDVPSQRLYYLSLGLLCQVGSIRVGHTLLPDANSLYSQ